MTTTIKITELADIGANLANNTLVPVVNMAGTPTTERANLNNLSDFVLSQGTGANLGAVGNITITGGTDGYVLQTDGAGNLSWTAQTGGGGNGTPGGANTQVQFNDAGSFGGNSGFTFNKTAGALASPMIDTAAVYHLAGTVIENADLTHGATSALIIPENGNTTSPAQLNNFYGNVVVQSGTDADHIKGWTFNSAGNLTYPDNTITTGSNITSPLNSDFNINTSYQTITAIADTGSGQDLFVITIASFPTITKVTTSWEVNTGTDLDPVWSAISDTHIGNPGEYNIFSSGFFFITGNSYTFRNPVVTTSNWTFDNTGNLTVPGSIKGNGQTYIDMASTANQVYLTTTGNDSTGLYMTATFAQLYANDYTSISSNVLGTSHNWTFENDGNLTLPTNTSSINYANGQPYAAAPVNTGNVSFNDFVVQGRVGYGLGLAPTPDDTANLKYLQVRAGDVDSHIHFDTGNYQAYDQYFGDDNKYLKLEKGLAGNVLIGTYQDGGIGQLHWTFDSNGNLILPENGRINAAGNIVPFSTTITNITTGAPTVIVTTTDNIFPGSVSGVVQISDVVGTTEANGSWYYLAVESNQFQLYNDSTHTSPVDGTSWTAYVSGGTAVSVGSAMSINASNITIDTGLGNSWTFDTKGDISFPQGSASFTKGRIQSANGYPTLLGYGSAPEHGGPELDWMNGDNPNDMSNNSVLRNTLYINENGFYVGMNENNFDLANNFSGSWRFGNNGGLTIPAGNPNNINSGQIFSDNESSFINLDVQFNSNVLGGVRLGTSATKPVDIVTGNGGGGFYTWRFDSQGVMYTPDGTVFGSVEGPGTFGFYNANNTNFLIEGPNNVTWSFDTGTANTTLPGNLNIAGNVSVAATSSASVTNEGGLPGVSGSQTITCSVSASPTVTTIQPGWTVTGNNLTTTTTVTSVVEFSPGNYEITTDTAETNPFWYNDVYSFTGTLGSFKTWTFDGTGNLTLPGDIKASQIGFPFGSNITGITTGDTTVIVTLANSPFPDAVTGVVTITGVVGTSQANGVWGFRAVNFGAFQLYTDITLTTPVDGTTWTAYVSGGFALSTGYDNLDIQGDNISITNGNDNSWTFTNIGYEIKPNQVVENTSDTVVCNAGAPTVIYTATDSNRATLKVILQVEGIEGSNTQWDTQSCEMVVAKSFRNNNVVGSVYGLAYTSVSPLATFNAVWNATTSRIEITCTPTSLTNGVEARVHVFELTTSN